MVIGYLLGALLTAFAYMWAEVDSLSMLVAALLWPAVWLVVFVKVIRGEI